MLLEQYFRIYRLALNTVYKVNLETSFNASASCFALQVLFMEHVSNTHRATQPCSLISKDISSPSVHSGSAALPPLALSACVSTCSSISNRPAALSPVPPAGGGGGGGGREGGCGLEAADSKQITAGNPPRRRSSRAKDTAALRSAGFLQQEAA